MNTVVRLHAPPAEKPTVRCGRGKNADYRQREYLTEGEIDSLLASIARQTKKNREQQPVAWCDLDYGPTSSESDDDFYSRRVQWNLEQAIRRSLRL